MTADTHACDRTFQGRYWVVLGIQMGGRSKAIIFIINHIAGHLHLMPIFNAEPSVKPVSCRSAVILPLSWVRQIESFLRMDVGTLTLNIPSRTTNSHHKTPPYLPIIWPSPHTHICITSSLQIKPQHLLSKNSYRLLNIKRQTPIPTKYVCVKFPWKLALSPSNQPRCHSPTYNGTPSKWSVMPWLFLT